MPTPVEVRATINASPEAIFKFYEDVANWHTWDPDTKSASLEGPFVVGTRGRLAPKKGRPRRTLRKYFTG